MKVKVEKYPAAAVKNGRLYFGGADTVALAKRFGTPLYLFDDATFRGACRAFRKAFESKYEDVMIVFACKANAMLSAMRLAAEEGLGLDVASAGELTGAILAGGDPEKIIFHGSYKKEEEIEMALLAGVGRIVLDSDFEADTVDRVAKRLGVKARVLLRVTPGIDAHVHEMVQVGKLDTKFGVPLKGGEALRLVGRIIKKKNIEFMGIHCHIGSQILDADPYRLAIQRMVSFIAELRDEYGVLIIDLDIGGGFPVRYDSKQALPTPEKFAAAVCPALLAELRAKGIPEPRLILEPGRSLAGPAGMTLYTVGPVKAIPGVRNYASVDGGLSDNPRPGLYGALYEAVIANRPEEKKGLKKFRVSGRHCETDTLIPDIELQDPRPGDVLAVFTTGAYNYSMSGNYNKFPRPATVLLSGGKPEIVVRRETHDDLYNCEIMPARLKNAKKKKK
ncbi:MAG: diaminopimelate decarboxylase [bacterium]